MSVRCTTLALALIGLTGCPESPKATDVTATVGSDGTPIATGADPAPPPGGTGSAPGPDDASQGPPDQPGRPPADVAFELGEGESVEITGVLRYAGDADGAVRLDFLTLEEGQPPALAHTLGLDRVGGFEVEAPKGFGDLHVVAFIDLDGDGPSPGDPAGTLQLSVGDEDLADVEIVLEDDPDLGDLTPGAGTEGPTPQGDGDAPPPADTLHGDETDGLPQGTAEATDAPEGPEGAEGPAVPPEEVEPPPADGERPEGDGDSAPDAPADSPGITPILCDINLPLGTSR